jgi:peptide/nickel transport system permease protein
MPSFWLAMLCIVFLTTAEYGSWLDLFPTSGVGMITDDMSWWSRTAVRSDHLTVPVICILVGSLAYLTRQMRGSMLRELRQDYIKLARAKGLSERRVLWHHAFRNALFPMITMIGSAFPAAVSGSIILEVIFSIPGMGRLLYQSILSKVWPVVYAMVLLAATLTVIGYLIADLLYKRADPRIVLQTRKP